MINIYTYPNNPSTGYINPTWYGSTTGGSETGYYKRILDLKDGTYKAWATGQTAPVDSVSDLITATGKFHKGVQTENGLENIMIYSYYNQPLVTLDSVLINTDISSSDTDASPAVRLTVTNSDDFVDGDQVLLTGFDGTLADQNNLNYYADVIDSTTVDLYYDSALQDPLKYFSIITGQAVPSIDYHTSTPLTSLVHVTLTGLGAAFDFANITFDTTGGSNLAQDRLASMGQFFVRHNTGNNFDLYQQAGGGAGLTVDDFLNEDTADINYTNFGVNDQALDYVVSGNTINYKVAANPAGNLMYALQKNNYSSGGGYWFDDLPGLDHNDLFTPDSTGDTSVDANTAFHTTMYHWGMTDTSLTYPDYGYYVEPQYYDVGSTTVQVNLLPKDVGTSSGNITYGDNRPIPRIQANYDELSDTDGGQQNNNAIMWNINRNEWVLSSSTSSNKITADGKDWKVNSVYTSRTQVTPQLAKTSNGNTPWGVLTNTDAMSTTEDTNNFQSYMKTEVIWNPNSTTDMHPIELELTFHNGQNTSYTPPTPAIWQELTDLWDGTNTEGGVWAEVVWNDGDAGIPVILIPTAKTALSGVLTKFTCTIFDARIWDVDYGKLSSGSQLPTESQGSHPNFANNRYNAYQFDLVRSQWAPETTGTYGSNWQYGPFNSGSLDIFTAERPGKNGLPFFNDYKLPGSSAVSLSSFYPGPGGPSQSVFTTTNNDTYFDKIRTGTLAWSVLGGGFNGAMKLLTSSSTTKTFAICPATGGTTSNPTAIDWSTHLTLTSNQLAGALTNQDTIFTVNTHAFTNYFQTSNLTGANEDIYFISDKVRYLTMKDVAGTTATVGANITDSTTGNIALTGTHNHKGDNPHIYFPGNQTYQQRTGASTYVNGATVSDNFYDIDSYVTDDFTTGTKPALTVSQSTEGYLNGVSLGSTGRITTGQKMLQINTLADTYTPPALTPAEQEDVWDTDDEWTSDGATTPEKVWPDHVTPQSAVINYNSPTLVNNSQSGIKYTRSVGHTKWRLEVTYPPMSAEDFKQFHAIAQAAHGQSTPFYFKLRNKDGVNILWSDFHDNPYNNKTIAPRLKDPITPGDTTMLTEGFLSNEVIAFERGEVFIDGENENGNLHTSLSSTDANIYGEAKIRTPWPFRTAQSTGTKIYKDPYWAIVTLGDDNFEYQVDVNNYYYVSVAFDLDSWK